MRMNRFILMVILSVALVYLVPATLGQEKRKPSTPEERAEAVRITRALETDPLSKDAKKTREKLLAWLIEVPDITFTTCNDLLLPVILAKKNYSKELVMQEMLSSAAFVIEHPDKAQDHTAEHVAGLEGTLRAYEAILKVKPKATLEHLDMLLEKRNKGELVAYVAGIMTTTCKNRLD